MHVVATIPERHMRSHTILKVRLLFEGGGGFYTRPYGMYVGHFIDLSYGN